jgi:hypothetical protein
MAMQRKINWSSAMRDMRNDRAPANSGFLATRAIEAARLDRLSKEAAAAPLAVSGSYDRSAIMKAAIAHAKAQKAKGNKAPWSSSWAPPSALSGTTPSSSVPSLLIEGRCHDLSRIHHLPAARPAAPHPRPCLPW